MNGIKVDDDTYRALLTEKIDGETISDTIRRMTIFYKNNKPVRRLRIPPMPDGEFL